MKKTQTTQYNNMDKYPMQVCQDEQLTTKFGELHKQLLNSIIAFCEENNVDVDELYFSADGLQASIDRGTWVAATDSSFLLEKSINDTAKENKNDKWEHKPFLWSL